jgi:hypothetical protein
MRCYFHLANGHDELLDETGANVATLEEARTAALKAIDELRREDPSLQRDWNGWELRIVDEAGRVLSVMRVNTIVYPVSGQRETVTPSRDDHAL